MKRVALGMCIATAFAASVAAQAGTQAPATTPAPQTTAPQPPSAAGAAGDITITGCLQKGADGTFMLSNVQQDPSATGTSGSTATPGAAASAPGATSTAGANAAASAASSWSLKGGTDLANHVGHRIAVTGKRAMAAPSSTTSGAAGATTSPAGATSGAAGATTSPAAGAAGTSGSTMSSARTLEVSTVKMVAATCP
jgi:hypothetical protein